MGDCGSNSPDQIAIGEFYLYTIEISNKKESGHMSTDDIVTVSPGDGLDREGSYTVVCNYRTLHSNNDKSNANN
jgi:hypothetical protein